MEETAKILLSFYFTFANKPVKCFVAGTVQPLSRLQHVLFMVEIGIIKGTDGKFMPKATITAETASGYATATNEQALAMSVRIYKNMLHE